MRSDRVPEFPDPGAGGGVIIGPDSGPNPKVPCVPAFQAGMQAYKHPLPGGGPPPEPAAQNTASGIHLSAARQATSDGFRTSIKSGANDLRFSAVAEWARNEVGELLRELRP